MGSPRTGMRTRVREPVWLRGQVAGRGAVRTEQGAQLRHLILGETGLLEDHLVQLGRGAVDDVATLLRDRRPYDPSVVLVAYAHREALGLQARDRGCHRGGVDLEQ